MGSKFERVQHYWRHDYGQFSYNGGGTTRSALTAICDYQRAGGDNPKYKTAIRSGLSATNGLLTENRTVYYKRPRVSAIYTDKVWRPSVTGEVIYSNGLSNWSPSAHSDRPSFSLREYVSNAALAGIIKKIRTYESSDFAGPTFVGELRETVSMLRSPVKALRLKTGLFTDLHMRVLRDKQTRGKRFKADPWKKVLSDTYLEWAFGAAPLLGDIGAIADNYLAMKNEAFNRNGLKRLSFRFSDQCSFPTTRLDLGWPGTYINVSVDQYDVGRSSEQYVVWIDHTFLFNDSGMERLSRLSRFDIYEVIPTLWELMPWSFLYDYFSNIGDVLGCAFQYNRNVAFAKKTTFETRTKFHANFKATSTDRSYMDVLDLKPHQYTSQYTRVQRDPVSKLGFPGLNFSLPSVGQTTNMAALVLSLSNSNPFRGHTLK